MILHMLYITLSHQHTYNELELKRDIYTNFQDSRNLDHLDRWKERDLLLRIAV